MKTLINWGHLLESGPNSVSSVSVSNDSRNQAFSDGIFPVLSINDAHTGADGATDGPVFTGGTGMDVLALPAVEGYNNLITYPPAAPCEYCGRPGQHHDAAGFDTETEDEDAAEAEPDFDNMMTAVYQAGEKQPELIEIQRRNRMQLLCSESKI